jgi:hypothetical protein
MYRFKDRFTCQFITQILGVHILNLFQQLNISWTVIIFINILNKYIFCHVTQFK